MCNSTCANAWTSICKWRYHFLGCHKKNTKTRRYFKFKTTEIFSITVLEARSSKSRCPRGYTSSRGFVGESAPCLFQLLEAVGIPWLATASVSALSSHHLPCVNVSVSFSHRKVHARASRVHPDNPG